MGGLNALCWVLAVVVAGAAAFLLAGHVFYAWSRHRERIERARTDDERRRLHRYMQIANDSAVVDWSNNTVMLVLPLRPNEKHFSERGLALTRALDFKLEGITHGA